MRLKNALLRAAAVPVLALVSSCGGGGGDNQPPPVTVPSTPAPTPTPTPPPSSAARFLVVAAGAMPAQVRIDSNNNGLFGDAGDALTTTNHAGEFGQGIAAGKPAQSVGTVPATPLYRMEATGLDSVSGFVFSGMRAPAGATILSPLTTLILAQGSETAVRSALGLAGGTDGLAASNNLLTFDPVSGLRSTDLAMAQDAARITSLNVQLMALAAIAKDTNGDPVDMNVSMVEGSRYLAELINANGTVRLSDKNLLLEVLKKSRYQFGTTGEQLDAMATLLAKYFALVPPRLASEQDARAWGDGVPLPCAG